MKIEIQSQQEFTYDGRVGAFMFICGPVLSGFGYAWLLNELSTSYPRPGLPLVVVGLGALGWVVGCVKMLAGRSYRHMSSLSDNLVPLFISTITALMLGSAVWFDLRRDFVGTARRQAWLSISADGTVLLAVVYDYIGRSVYLFPQPVMVPHPLLPVRPGILCGTPAKMPGR